MPARSRQAVAQGLPTCKMARVSEKALSHNVIVRAGRKTHSLSHTHFSHPLCRPGRGSCSKTRTVISQRLRKPWIALLRAVGSRRLRCRPSSRLWRDLERLALGLAGLVGGCSSRPLSRLWRDLERLALGLAGLVGGCSDCSTSCWIS